MFISVDWVFHPCVPNTQVLIIWTSCEILTWTSSKIFLYLDRTDLLIMSFEFTYFSICSKIIAYNPSIPAPRKQRIALILPDKGPNPSNMSIILVQHGIILSVPNFNSSILSATCHKIRELRVPLYTADIWKFSYSGYTATGSPQVYAPGKPNSKHRVLRTIE